MPAAITIESSYAAMDRDMGSSHIAAHSNQHKYLIDGEDPVDYLLPINEKLSIVQQAIQAGIRVGQLRSEAEWKQYNQEITRKDRRLNSYDDYVQKVCSTASKKLYRDFDKALQNPKTPKAKRSMIATEFNSLASHQDIPIIGTLFYFGDAGEFEQAKKDGCFKQLKQADKMAGNLFFNSREFRCLHPQMFKLERHNDESGRPHLQGMETCFTTSYRNYKTKKGSVKKRIDNYGKTQYQLDGLIRFFGSPEAVNTQLDRLIELQQKSQNEIKKNSGNRVGLVRPEASMLMDNFDPKEAKLASDKITKDVKPSTLNKMRRQNIAQLTRVIDFGAMAKAKTTVYKQLQLPAKYYQTTISYTTDGKHLTAHQYRLKMAAQDEGKSTVDKAKAAAKRTKKAAQDDANSIVKAAKKKTKGIVDDAQAKQEEAEQAKNEALYDKAKVDHQVHVAEMRLANLNKQVNNKSNQLDDQQEQLKQNQLKLKQQREQHAKLVKENSQLITEVKHNSQIVQSIAGLKHQAKVEGLSVNGIVSDRSKLINKIRLIGKAYAVVERTARIAVALMLGTQIRPHESKELPSERAFGAGITLENYENPFTTSSEKQSMTKLPIILAMKASTWLETKYKEKFGRLPFENKSSQKFNPQIKIDKSEEQASK